MEHKKDISVVLGTYNRKQFLKLTIDSIRKEMDKAGLRVEIIVIDGGSTDGTAHWLAGQKDVISIFQHNRGVWRGQPIKRRSWAYFMNLGFKIAQGKYILMVSDDCIIVPGAMRSAYDHTEQRLNSGSRVGAVPFWWRHWPEQPDYGVHYFYGVMNMNNGFYVREALADVGYADEETYEFYAADVDIVFKMIAAGYEITDSPDSYIEHFSHANLEVRAFNWNTLKPRDDARLKEKWAPRLPDKDFGEDNRWRRATRQYVDPSRTADIFGRLVKTDPGLIWIGWQRWANKLVGKVLGRH
jgi:glycosyltransferase involved in cell wall biosynthesis